MKPWEMFNQEKYSDCILKVTDGNQKEKEEEFFISKFALASQSKFFDKLFYSSCEWLETKSKKVELILPLGTLLEAAKVFFLLLYDPTFTLSDEKQDLNIVLQCCKLCDAYEASFFVVEKVHQLLVNKKIKDWKDADLVLRESFLTSSSSNYEPIVKACEKILETKFHDLPLCGCCELNSDFITLCPKSMTAVLKSSCVKTDSENTVWTVFLNWWHHHSSTPRRVFQAKVTQKKGSGEKQEEQAQGKKKLVEEVKEEIEKDERKEKAEKEAKEKEQAIEFFDLIDAIGFRFALMSSLFLQYEVIEAYLKPLICLLKDNFEKQKDRLTMTMDKALRIKKQIDDSWLYRSCPLSYQNKMFSSSEYQQHRPSSLLTQKGSFFVEFHGVDKLVKNQRCYAAQRCFHKGYCLKAFVECDLSLSDDPKKALAVYLGYDSDVHEDTFVHIVYKCWFKLSPTKDEWTTRERKSDHLHGPDPTDGLFPFWGFPDVLKDASQTEKLSFASVVFSGTLTVRFDVEIL